ncbi:S-adenosyl-L-methionine-dependent methyltransferase [Syncephalis plumigaleata]|nr:S-adenosyl-L-methionine-dependent methyltransferase [Syncephalis plumigaleata]
MTRFVGACQRTLFTKRFQSSLSLLSVYTRIQCREQHQLSTVIPEVQTTTIETTTSAFNNSNTFQWGDMVLLRETRKGKRSLIGPLKHDGVHMSHLGKFEHEAIIDRVPRSKVISNRGAEFTVHHPTLEEYVLMATRHCTPIYPKDASAIISMLDLHPGDRVLECGTGNGALTLHLARAIAGSTNEGRVITVEKRESHASSARTFISQYRRGSLLPWIEFHTGDLAGGELTAQWGSGSFDAIVLDMPDPATPSIIESVRRLLRNDGYCLCYLPNMTQVIATARAATELPGGGLAVEQVTEVVWREWKVCAAQPAWLRRLKKNGDTSTSSLETEDTNISSDSKSDVWVCHPSHTPTGHTGFLVTLRKCEVVRESANN